MKFLFTTVIISNMKQYITYPIGIKYIQDGTSKYTNGINDKKHSATNVYETVPNNLSNIIYKINF